MIRLIKLSIFVICIIFIQGCSNNKSFSDEELNTLVSSVSYSNLDKVEFNKEKNELNIFIFDEFINDSETNKILDNIKLNNSSLKSIINNINFNNKKFNISIFSANKNEILIIDDNYKINIVNDKYSLEYVNKKLLNLSKNIVSFNNYVGGIETDLKKNKKNENKLEEFRKVYKELIANIDDLEILIKHSNINNSNELNKKITLAKELSVSLNDDVEKSFNTNSNYYINSNFLKVNELDKISRELN